ncbi:hypothetical protein ADICEAN_03282 [Cesiribacter andamanensis AMV16]|uniref:Uncharacterized protein n=1 Tax=Cesiribacter andamanensis AMV16 TaxID=1279009 RepID=M7N2Q3_9BACT|nr:hypothetical protein ADICEAN_03282 [Cesiribacter andamanensis AMV16]
MVYHYPHGNIGLLLFSIGNAGIGAYLLDHGLKNVRIVVRGLELNGAHQALKAHARIHMAGGQQFQAAIGLAVKLDEYQVPDLDYLGMVIVDQLPARHPIDLCLGAQVDVNFGAGTAGAGIAHLPEIVFFISV